MKKRLLASVLSLILPAPVIAQDTTTVSENADAEKPYEVVISAKPSRAYLRGLIEDVEEDFFDRFNELNEDDMYDMYCYEYTPTMTHIKKRACEPLFMIRYRAEQSSDGLFMLQSGGGGGDANSFGSKIRGVYLQSEREMRRNRASYYETLTQKLEAYTETDQTLGEIANAMQQLKYRLENYDSQ